MWQKGWHGILIADDMGLGKTLQTLTFIGGLKKFCEINSPVLIVAPTALLANWQAEYKKFLRGSIFSEVIPLHGGELRKFLTDERTPNKRRKLSLKDLPINSIALTTYETLLDYQFSFAEIQWSVIIADEAQKIKNPNAGMTIALKAMKYDFAICLSGTPVENSWQDLWSIMDFVQPSHLDELKTFKEKYIDGATGENIKQRGKELRKNLEPLILRRMKEDYLEDLPVKNVYLCREEMPLYQREIYYAVLEKYRRGGFKTPLNFISKLREVSLHPDLGTMSEEKLFELDADIKTLTVLMNLPDEILSARYWRIEDVDTVTGLKFEEITTDLYNGMGNFTAEKTPATNDFGADVVVKSATSNTGLLIQCKHTENFNVAIGSEGVQEICTAIAHYEQKYNGRKFQPVVVTNAENFTSGAIRLAKDNGVQLITRRELGKMFNDYKIPKC